MKLVHCDYEAVLSFDNENCVEWIIENPIVYRKIVDELIKQLEGEDGNFVLSEKDKIISISKNADLIINLFEIDVNQRKILNKIYLDIKDISYDDKFYLATHEIISDIQKYFYDIDHELTYNIHIDSEIDIIQIMKSVGICIETESTNLLEQLCEYIKISAKLLGVRLFVLCNARSFLLNDEVIELCKMAFYENCYILLLENQEQKEKFIKDRYIIDKDGCEIFENDIQ